MYRKEIRLHLMAGIDYGCIVFKNGKRYKSNQLYPKINLGELGNIVYYKCLMECYDEFGNEIKCYYFGYGDDKKAYHFNYNGINYCVKEICDRVYRCEFNHNSDKYFIVFGYGIDNDKEVWDDVKYDYLGKRNARKIDNVLRRFEDWKCIKK